MLQMLFGNLKPCYARNAKWKYKHLQFKLYWTKSVECIVKCKNKQKKKKQEKKQKAKKKGKKKSSNKKTQVSIKLIDLK